MLLSLLYQPGAALFYTQPAIPRMLEMSPSHRYANQCFDCHCYQNMLNREPGSDYINQMKIDRCLVFSNTNLTPHKYQPDIFCAFRIIKEQSGTVAAGNSESKVCYMPAPEEKDFWQKLPFAVTRYFRRYQYTQPKFI